MSRWLDLFHKLQEEHFAAEPEPADMSRLGEHAQRLMADPYLQLAFDLVGKKLQNTWAASPPADVEGRERAHAEHRALMRVRGELLAMIGDVKLLEAEEKRREAKPRRF